MLQKATGNERKVHGFGPLTKVRGLNSSAVNSTVTFWATPYCRSLLRGRVVYFFKGTAEKET